MIMRVLIYSIFICTLILAAGAFTFADEQTPRPNPESYNSNQITHPAWYLNVTDWSFFTAARVAMLSSVVIENTADIAYKDIRILISYYSSSGPAVGQTIATTTGMLPVTVPPKSKDKYLKGGITMGAGNQGYRISDIEVLSATPITD